MNPVRLLPVLSLLLTIVACNRNSSHTSISDCPTCPNNTVCIDGDCGCPPDQYDMGSWCLQKHQNLFVAASLDCPCLDVLGLYLLNIQPEQDNGGGVTLPGSTYALVGRGNVLGTTQSNFSYYKLPDGDSIAIYSIPMPGAFGVFDCRVKDSLFCEVDLMGKFHGPDTIETQVLYRRCLDDSGNGSNFQEAHHLTFVRRK